MTTLSPAWRDQAACRTEDPDLFFPAGTEGPSSLQIEKAKAVCRRCPVAEACLAYAFNHPVNDGIFGGLTAGERRTIVRRHMRGRPAPKYTRPAASLAEAVERRTTPTDDGHLLWNGVPHVAFRGQRYTGTRAVFLLGHGREPIGILRRTCDEPNCVHHEHLADEVIRDAEDVCGTRKGYLRHRARGEDCQVCRQANTDADNRLRRTGTSKAAA
ncbi:hypothetical protein RKD48_001125 [Streptomyces ambofaciens]